ncbi:sensor histidine kinase [Halocola ammonii]
MKRRLKFNLRMRIWLSMLALILLAFLLTGLTAYYHYKQQNEEYHEQRLQRKENAVQSSMDYFLRQRGGHISQDSVTAVFSSKICELSDIHNLPINMYNLDGELIISSNPAFQEEKQLPENIEYTILKQLATGNTRAVIDKHYEKDEYFLAYWYFMDSSDKPIAIINIPYFDTERINPEELNIFLIQLTEIYILLFIGAGALAYFLSNYITISLKTIGQRLKTVEFGKKNKPIKWHADDEIGTLVDEYNRMLKEVERSANLLARSERESAWREMAKQVAHEIKNPLTPMKLRVQHLERAWQDQKPDFDERLRNFSKSLVEQIDTLTNIANEFSHFAKMPKAKIERIDLSDTIKSSLELFQESEKVEFNFEDKSEGKAWIRADKDHLTRVFNNLITNAIQAIPDSRPGKVDVLLKRDHEQLLVEVRDNGEGIPEDKQNKIFEPNFTTKRTGTGLGLAMVKNIIENSRGEVWFESVPGSGTVFFISFPAA